MFRLISKLVFRILGWKVIDLRPKGMGSCIYVVAPHTSSWDFLVGIMARSIARLGKAYYLGKKELFVWPLGYLMRALGGVPVDRSKGAPVIDQVVHYFKTIPGFSIGIAPEGTRKRVTRWKTGFYRIAEQANVPLIMTSFDYGRKEVIFKDPFTPTGDMDKDLAWMMDYFKQFKGRHPEHGVH